uniref:gamma-glutamylcyclotransferase n=1 Tax=Caenorhabditis japonica TaxID=281687 RepID=A0A8R1I643_CAEJA
MQNSLFDWSELSAFYTEYTVCSSLVSCATKNNFLFIFSFSVSVQTPQGNIKCRTYQYSDLGADPKPPSPHYKLVIVEGAKEHKLPAEYIEQLEKIKDNGFTGSVGVNIPLLEKLNKSPEL